MGLASKLASSSNPVAPSYQPPSYQAPSYPTQAVNNYEQQYSVSAPLAPHSHFDAPPKYSPEYSTQEYSNSEASKQNAVLERMKSFNPFSSKQAVQESQVYKQQQQTQDFWNTTQKSVGTNKYKSMIDQKINTIIRENHWEGFYPPHKLQGVLDVIYKHDYDELARRWQYPNIEIVIELVSLALVDVIIFYDDSGSMEFDEQWKATTEKKEDMSVFMSRIAEITTLFDSDGISLMPFKDKTGHHGITSERSVAGILNSTKFGGGTPIGANLLNNIITPFVTSKVKSNSLEKPVLVYIVTDGAPDVKDEVYNAIYKTKTYLQKTQYGTKGICYQFLQVGRDAAAQKYLETLDNDVSIGDIIDCTSFYELEEQEYARNGIELTPTLYITKAAVGAIDSSWDEMDKN